MDEAMLQKWRGLLRGWNVDAKLADEAFCDIAEHYGESSRYYHTLEHIQGILDRLESLDAHLKNPGAVKLAGWLHDVIYDSKAEDNEERSADYAMRLCEKLSIPEGRAVAHLIRKTKDHEAGGDGDAQVLLDADLAILGASEPEYQEYATRIRQEYAWVPDAEWRKGRGEILQHLL